MAIEVGRLTGLEKTALILLSAGEAHAEKIFSLLNKEESCIIRQSMQKIETINDEAKCALLKEIFSKLSAANSQEEKSITVTEVVAQTPAATNRLPLEEANRNIPARKIWDLLNGMNEAALTSHIMAEYPQTICVLLSNMAVQQAARILSQLPESLSLEVVMRLLRKVNIKTDVSRFVNRVFEKNMPVSVSSCTDRDSSEFVAEIFSNFDQNVEENLLLKLEHRDMAAAISVRNKMFKFCDLSRLSAPGIQLIISLAPKDNLALALKGEPPEVKSAFFSCMSERAVRILSEDMESFGSASLKDIENAQKNIACIAVTLIKDNKISVSEHIGKFDHMKS